MWSRRRDHDENARLGMPEWQSIKTSLLSSISAFILGLAAARWMSRRAFVGRTAGEMPRLGTGQRQGKRQADLTGAQCLHMLRIELVSNHIENKAQHIVERMEEA
ncbi:hypothetical protein [Paenibacillus sp. HGF5]|uniref:hypothetical protein n=1 Tax=Paenibacillus sp. HGF5 TaxID=908341 RepID=UPI00055D6FBE|nr:hypothetical protein [Paenibacillus sp. HGF5]